MNNEQKRYMGTRPKSRIKHHFKGETVKIIPSGETLVLDELYERDNRYTYAIKPNGKRLIIDRDTEVINGKRWFIPDLTFNH